jgi:xanthine/uracil permease
VAGATFTVLTPMIIGAGTVICVIGLSLIGADVSLIAGDDPAAKDYGQVSHIALAGLVVLLIVVITRAFRGFISQIAVLGSIGIGTLAAWPMGLLHFTGVSSSHCGVHLEPGVSTTGPEARYPARRASMVPAAPTA